MAGNKPQTHLEEAQKLTADALVDLFEIRLKPVEATIRIKNDDTVEYLGYSYEAFPIEMTGESESADEEEARPRIRIFNPEGIFNELIRQGLLDRATVIRRRVLRQHLDSNTSIYQQRMWYVARVSEVISGQTVQLELRTMSEGPNFQIPARMYIPPDFPMVRLR